MLAPVISLGRRKVTAPAVIVLGGMTTRPREQQRMIECRLLSLQVTPFLTLINGVSLTWVTDSGFVRADLIEGTLWRSTETGVSLNTDLTTGWKSIAYSVTSVTRWNNGKPVDDNVVEVRQRNLFALDSDFGASTWNEHLGNVSLKRLKECGIIAMR